MRRKRPALGVYSASAIDLFASALGAFVIITIIALPYFPNLSRPDLEDQLSKLQAELDSTTKQRDDALDALSALRSTGQALIGLETDLKRFQIAVDLSGSIRDYTDDVREVVSLVAKRLPADGAVRLVGWTSDSTDTQLVLRDWRNGQYIDASIPSLRDDMIAQVNQWFTGELGFTPTFATPEHLISQPQATSILLLTDGNPTRNKQVMTRASVERGVERIVSLNRGRHQITILALGEFANSTIASAMVPLTSSSGGNLISIPKVP